MNIGENKIVMNIHVSKAIQDRWKSHEFRGVRRTSRYGFDYIMAFHKILGENYFYVFGANSFVDRDGISQGAPELIFSEEYKDE